MKKSKESFYKNLKIKLDESHIWPSKYVFKFIIKNNFKKKSLNMSIKKILNEIL